MLKVVEGPRLCEDEQLKALVGRIGKRRLESRGIDAGVGPPRAYTLSGPELVKLAVIVRGCHAANDAAMLCLGRFEVLTGETLSSLYRAFLGRLDALYSGRAHMKESLASFPVTAPLLSMRRLGESYSGFNPDFTARESTYFNAAIIGLLPQEIREGVDDVITLANIGDYIDQPVKAYSIGMFFRLACSIATAVQPDLLLVHESLGAGDIFFRQKCYAYLRAKRGHSMAVILVTHLMADAAEFWDRGVVRSQGRIMCAGSRKEAVEYYPHHERETPTGRGAERGNYLPARRGTRPAESERHRADRNWEADPAAAYPIIKEQLGSDNAQALRPLVSELDDSQKRMFEEREWMRLRASSLVQTPLKWALLGVRVRDKRDMLVHRKNGSTWLPPRQPAFPRRAPLR